VYEHSASQDVDPRDTARGIDTIDKHQDDVNECQYRDTNMIITIEEDVHVCEEGLEDVLDLQIDRREVEVEANDTTSLIV